jgi:hypothetical protein
MVVADMGKLGPVDKQELMACMDYLEKVPANPPAGVSRTVVLTIVYMYVAEQGGGP